MTERRSIEETERLAKAIARHLEPFLKETINDLTTQLLEDMVQEISRSLTTDTDALADKLKELLRKGRAKPSLSVCGG